MPWTIAIEETKSGKARMITEGEQISADDPQYGDVHILHCTVEGDGYSFGAHEFSRKCYCRPRLKIEFNERPMVIHEERQVN